MCWVISLKQKSGQDLAAKLGATRELLTDADGLMDAMEAVEANVAVLDAESRRLACAAGIPEDPPT